MTVARAPAPAPNITLPTTHHFCNKNTAIFCCSDKSTGMVPDSSTLSQFCAAWVRFNKSIAIFCKRLELKQVKAYSIPGNIPLVEIDLSTFFNFENRNFLNENFLFNILRRVKTSLYERTCCTSPCDWMESFLTLAVYFFWRKLQNEDTDEGSYRMKIDFCQHSPSYRQAV